MSEQFRVKSGGGVRISCRTGGVEVVVVATLSVFYFEG
jgi:hypothetical protein